MLRVRQTLKQLEFVAEATQQLLFVCNILFYVCFIPSSIK